MVHVNMASNFASPRTSNVPIEYAASDLPSWTIMEQPPAHGLSDEEEPEEDELAPTLTVTRTGSVQYRERSGRFIHQEEQRDGIQPTQSRGTGNLTSTPRKANRTVFESVEITRSPLQNINPARGEDASTEGDSSYHTPQPTVEPSASPSRSVTPLDISHDVHAGVRQTLLHVPLKPSRPSPGPLESALSYVFARNVHVEPPPGAVPRPVKRKPAPVPAQIQVREKPQRSTRRPIQRFGAGPEIFDEVDDKLEVSVDDASLREKLSTEEAPFNYNHLDGATAQGPRLPPDLLSKSLDFGEQSITQSISDNALVEAAKQKYTYAIQKPSPTVHFFQILDDSYGGVELGALKHKPRTRKARIVDYVSPVAVDEREASPDMLSTVQVPVQPQGEGEVERAHGRGAASDKLGLKRDRSALQEEEDDRRQIERPLKLRPDFIDERESQMSPWTTTLRRLVKGKTSSSHVEPSRPHC